MVMFMQRNWFHVGAVLFAALAFGMGFWGHDHLSPIRIILVYSFMALLAHQYEEYAIPGGAPVILNAAFYGEKTDYDRFPGNQRNCLIVNMLAYPFYLAAILWPGAIWLGLATMFFGFFQVLGHGVIMNIRSKGWYNPGLATAVLLHLPIGIYYISYVSTHGSIASGDWLLGALGFIVATAVLVVLPVQGLKDRQSPYPFTYDEHNALHLRDKLIARGVI